MQKARRCACVQKSVVVSLLLVPCIIAAVVVWSVVGGNQAAVTKDDTAPVRVRRVHRQRLARSKPPNWLSNDSAVNAAPTGFVVDTPSCRIPDFDAFNPSILRYVRDPAPRFNVCNQSLPVTFTDRQFIRLNTTLALSLGVKQCFYQQV